ncbi:MAG TPA: hypothetical protein VNN20_03560 [Thermodesulfobacteriota bacterium]|nr:hypothetical protein [Thermodesulfobacteriota bacterium]
MKKAIVIGYGVSSLGVIRSLGLKGLQVASMYYDKTDFSHTSKYVYEGIQVPSPNRGEREFIYTLIKHADRWKGSLVFDTDDAVTVAISRHRRELGEFYTVVTSGWEVVRRFIEKKETYRIAKKCDVPYPMTLFPNSLDELEEIKDKIEYPCILKPVRVHEFARRFNSKNFKVDNYDQLLSKFILSLETGHEVMVQEIIPGPPGNMDNYTVYVNTNGDVGARFHRLKVRQNPPQFGITRVGISHDRILEVEEFTEKLLREAGFRGIATAEFKRDPRDNRFKLLEVNARTIRSNWLSTYCGVNFPWIAYLDLAEGKQIDVKDYRKNVYWIDLNADIYNLTFRRSQENLGIKDFLKPYLARDKSFSVLSLDDPRPFLTEIATLPIRQYRLFRSGSYE